MNELKTVGDIANALEQGIQETASLKTEIRQLQDRTRYTFDFAGVPGLHD